MVHARHVVRGTWCTQTTLSRAGLVSPALTAVLAHFVLKEPLGARGAMGCLVSLAGVVFIWCAEYQGLGGEFPLGPFSNLAPTQPSSACCCSVATSAVWASVAGCTIND